MKLRCILSIQRYQSNTVDGIHPVHRAQLLTYLKLSGRSIGFLINWKVPRLKDAIQRMIWRERYGTRKNVFFAVFEVFEV